MKPFNPKYLYPFAIFTVGISGMLLSLNYRLLGEKQLASTQVRQIWVWSFLIMLGLTLIMYLLYGKVQSAKTITVVYFYLSNLAVTHLWIKKQYQIYNSR